MESLFPRGISHKETIAAIIKKIKPIEDVILKNQLAGTPDAFITISSESDENRLKAVMTDINVEIGIDITKNEGI
jgi:hypothetical protein